MQALDILQRWLDDMSAAVLRGDWDVYRHHVALPFHLVTEQASLVIVTEDELRPGFDNFHRGLQVRRVTDYLRLADSAMLLDHGLLSGHYISHILSGGQRILPPFRSQITVRRQGGPWRAATITTSLNTSRWPVGLPAESDLTGPAPEEAAQ
ncbi:MAG: hypothetical protein IE927_09170 [Rhodobacterales bacterium]|nr:hypothetical protein [Rhodobacterales bacterium]